MRQVNLAKIALAHHRVERMALGLRSAVNGEVFYRRDGLEVFRVIALQTANELHGKPSREKRILAVGLLPSAPARVAKEIDVRRPERQSLVSLMRPRSEILVVLGAR